MEKKDLLLKQQIEDLWSRDGGKYASYGHKRLAIHFKLNKKRVRRVMKKYNLRPYKRKKKPWKYSPQTDEDLQKSLEKQSDY